MNSFKQRNALILFVLLIVITGCAGQEKMIKDTTKAEMVVEENPIDWAKDAVWYQIFPERFRNGDPSNDPKASDSPETARIEGWHISSWTADWYELSDYEKVKSPNFYDNVFDRRYGVLETYERLKNLIESSEEDVRRAIGGNKAAGTRVRKLMQDVKNDAQALRVKVLEVRDTAQGDS